MATDRRKCIWVEDGRNQTFKEACLNVPFSVNVTQSNYRIKIPHIDYPLEYTTRGFAGLVYLNKPEECKGGTGFYTYKGIQADPNQIGITNDGFKLVHTAEMKYNRFIMYTSNILHKAIDQEGWFEDDLHRLTQVFYLHT